MKPSHGASLALLLKASEKFRFYERNHRAKADRWGAELVTETRPRQRRDLEVKIVDTIGKAEANAELAGEIEAHLQRFSW